MAHLDTIKRVSYKKYERTSQKSKLLRS